MRLHWPSVGIALILFLVEVIIATQLNQQFIIRAYVGDFLVVILLYYLIKACFDIQPKSLGLGIFVFSVAVEVAQYFKIADLLGLAQGSIARIVVGTSFSWVDILAYALGCVTVYYLDGWVSKPRYAI